MRYLAAFIAAVALSTSLLAIDAGGRSNHGEEITVDLPDSEHRRNTTSRGEGCCTWWSLHHAAVYQNVPAFMEAGKWIMEKGIPGGASPSDWTRHLPRMAAERGYPMPDWIQITNRDAEWVKLALRTGRYVCITYDGRDGVFYRGPILHMVNIVHWSDDWVALHDNNFPRRYLWMSPQEFMVRWSGWAAVILNAPPPPIPVNK